MRAQIQRIYVHQIDHTQDISGAIIFSLSLANPCSELHAVIKELGKLIGMSKSEVHNQLLTCIQYVNHDNAGKPQERMKIYNKLVHFVSCG